MQNEIKFILIRHQEGARNNQIEEFGFGKQDQLSLGRSSANDVRFEGSGEDMVSREHAVITISKGDRPEFTLTDNNSTNGTFVNGQKLTGSRKLLAGDKIQLGKNGPVFEFDLNPVPDYLIQKTRVMDIPKATTVMDTPSTPDPVPMHSEQMISPSTPLDVKSGVGKTTVERMIHKERKKNRNVLYVTGALVLALIAAALWYFNDRSPAEPPAVVNEEKGMTPDAIAAANRDKVVFIEVGWKLQHTPTGQEIFHVYEEYQNEQTGQSQYVPAYIELPSGKIEPLCQAGQPNGYSVLISSQSTGSGFFVSDNGHIITNRHVAASWNTAYAFPPGSFPGVLYQQNARGEYEIGQVQVTQDMVADFVPAGMQSFGFDIMKEKRVIKGENAYLDVVLPGKDNRIPATIANISDEHDVAMIKIDLPGNQPYVNLDEKSPEVAAGKEVVVMGYPGISPNQVKIVRSQDLFNRGEKIRERPEPSVTNGTIAKLVSGSSMQEELYSQLGELYQLNINTTGSGNSGGPVFDINGNVIGIYTSGGGTSNLGIISFAVPVKYALDIMGG